MEEDKQNPEHRSNKVRRRQAAGSSSDSSHVELHRPVKNVLPVPADQPLPDFKPSDYVVVKYQRSKHWSPFQVLPTTHMAVKDAERATWIQGSNCRKVPPPPENHQEQMAK
ncbi:hypothetical protein ABVT39_009988 [Epinephelus coioides]